VNTASGATALAYEGAPMTSFAPVPNEALHPAQDGGLLVGAEVGADGGLSAAFALSLAGDSAKLKQLAEKDPVARKLLPKP